MQTTRTPYSISFMATVLLLLLFACHSTIANAAVALGATRVIYPANQKQVLLPVTNNDPASVYLIQSWIENAGDQKDTQFVITPPLFSMQGKKENTLRIINATNHQLPGDRESLFWVNVKAIPAMEKDQKNENTLQLAIISRIKMFYRPTNLAMAPEEAPAMLHLISVQWSHRWAESASRYSWFRHMRRPFLLSYFLILFCQISCFQMIYMLLPAVTVLLLWPVQQHSCNNHKHKKCNQYHIGFAVCSLIAQRFHLCSSLSATVAAGFHGHGKVVRATERRYK